MTRRLLWSCLVWGALACLSVRETEGNRSVHPGSAGMEIQQLIRSFSGQWAIEFTIEPSKSLPKGGQGHGTELWRSGPGGLSLIEEYESQGDDGSNIGHGIFWFEESHHHFQVLWCANDVPSGCMAISEGATWKDGELVLQHRWESRGKVHIMKEVFSEIKAGSFSQTVYMGDGSGNLEVQYKIRATRKKQESHD